MKIVRINENRGDEKIVGQVDDLDSGLKQIATLARQEAAGFPHPTRIVDWLPQEYGVYADDGENQELLLAYRLEIEPTEQTPGIYRGWKIDYSDRRPDTGKWRAYRAGITFSGSTLASVKDNVDWRIKNYPGSGGA